MIASVVAFIVSAIMCMLIIRYENLHFHITADDQLSDPQKFHSHSVSRIGGCAIVIGILAAALTRHSQNIHNEITILTLVICTLPMWLIGSAEDITQKISIKLRLYIVIFGAWLASFQLNSWITHVDIIGIDTILSIQILSITLTCIAITGLTNAYNIIDGFNGLSSIVASITLLAIAYVALRVNDTNTLVLAIVAVGAISGFFIWNYPNGYIFLGDGGAYLIGSWVAILSILLINRNPSVSPWFAFAVNGYPVVETLFSIWRKKIHKNKSPGQADACHLHSLIYRRIIRKINITHGHKKQIYANSKTSIYLWVLTFFSVLPAVLWLKYNWALQISIILFASLYIYLYISIIKFKIPRWLKKS